MRVVNTLVVENGKILLLYKESRQKWFLPGGKSEFGEHILQTGIREFCEETGLMIKDAALGAVTTIIVEELEHEWLLFTVIGSKPSGKLLEQTREGILEWHPVEEIKNLPMFEGDRHIILQLLEQKMDKPVITSQYYTPDYELKKLLR